MTPQLPALIETLSSVCSAFFENLDRRALLSRILQSAIQMTEGDRGSLFLASEEKPTQRGAPSPVELTSFIATGIEGKEIKLSQDQGIVGHVFKKREPLIIQDARKDPRFYEKIDLKTSYETKTILCVPLLTPSGKALGVLEILNSKRGQFTDSDQKLLSVLALFAAVAIEQHQTIFQLTEAHEGLKGERGKWLEKSESTMNQMIHTNHPIFQQLLSKIPSYATSDSSILIEGESGTGKEVLARVLHAKSNRRDRPFIAINCAAIPESLFEAELFGLAKGAATGTVARKGKIEMAHTGTLFLDEIGELPLSMQAKLLRVLQDKKIARVGSEEEVKSVDFRIIAATNRNLQSMVAQGTYREDLYYRINVIRMKLPRLAERKEDIPELCTMILKKFHSDRGWRLKKLSPAALKDVLEYDWPGNIRQLQNKLEGAVIVSGDCMVIEPQDLQLEAPTKSAQIHQLSVASPQQMVGNLDLRAAKELLEQALIAEALARTGGNKTKAAALLGITREGLRKAMKMPAKRAA